MMDLDDETELDIPQELVLRIFEDGARAHTELAHSLCLVSRWTCVLALPELYDTVVLKTTKQKIAFAQAIKESITLPATEDGWGDGTRGEDSNPSCKKFPLKDLVKSLWLEPVSNRTLDIFRQCTGLTHIALPLINLLWLVDSSTAGTGYSRSLGRDCFTNRPNLQLLLLGGGDSGRVYNTRRWTLHTYVDPQRPENTSPLFSMVSHIQLAGFSGDLSADDPPVLNHYTNLSHLALRLRNPSNLLQPGIGNPTTNPSINPVLGAILEHPPLTHLVLVLYTDTEFQLTSPHGQRTLEIFRSLRPRYPKLFLVAMEYQHLQRDWEVEGRGGKTFWERAEEFTASL